MKSYVYRSPKKPELYVYLPERDKFEKIPATVLKAFGTPEFVFELELTPERKLARADVNEVMRCLREQGFYLQMPPAPELELARLKPRE